MPDTIDRLLVDVRANTQGFAQDVAAMRSTFDGTLVDGFERAGGVLERGLLGAIRRGSLGFDDLKRTALSVIDDIVAQAVNGLFTASSGQKAGGVGGLLNFSGLLGSVLGLPGRATGGPVAPGRGYLVGERGPELFVPASAGQVVPGGTAGSARDVRVSINITSPTTSSAPQALQRSGRQVASVVRRALTQN